MEFYLLLLLQTSVIAALALLLWLKTGHVGFPVGIGFLYFWSLYGAWSIVTDQLGGDSGKRYDYLLAKMFPVELDENYLWSLLLYATFIILVELTILCLLPRGRQGIAFAQGSAPASISHVFILLLSAAAIVTSFLIMQDQLLAAAQLNMSAYYATRGGLGEYNEWFTLHQVLNRVALFALAIGFAVYVTGDASRFLVGSKGLTIGLAYIGSMLGTFGFLAMLGNKNELFSAFILGGLFYLANARPVKWALVAPIGMLAFIAIAAIDFLRGLSMFALLESGSWWDAFAWAPEIRSSNEAFAAHFSLYGVFHFNAAYTYGASLIAFVTSIVPRMFWPERPEGTYVQYAENLGIYEGATGQGYTVHHATGWYLNFGIGGLIIGALLLGFVWAKCYNAHRRATCGDRRWTNVLAIVAPAGFVSFIPPLVRAGPEAYKGMIIEAFLIPTMIVWLASIRWGQLLGVPKPLRERFDAE
jgi:hypothetical protein